MLATLAGNFSPGYAPTVMITSSPGFSTARRVSSKFTSTSSSLLASVTTGVPGATIAPDGSLILLVDINRLIVGESIERRPLMTAANAAPVGVVSSLSSGATLGSNRVLNPGMETAGSSPPLANWSAFGSGYTASTTTAHGGTRSLQCAAASAGEVHGGYQTIVLNQTTPKALKLSGEMIANGPLSALPQMENELAWLMLTNTGLESADSRKNFQKR